MAAALWLLHVGDRVALQRLPLTKSRYTWSRAVQTSVVQGSAVVSRWVISWLEKKRLIFRIFTV